MDALVRAAAARPETARTAIAVVGAVAVAALVATGLGLPLLGIPPVLGAVAYAAIRLSPPDKVLRGHTLSPSQHRRTAAIVGGGILVIAALYSGSVWGLDLAGRLERRLHDEIEIADGGRTLKLGQTLEECERFVCARATIVGLATDRTLGMAKLNGFAVHGESAYGWRRTAPASVLSAASSLARQR